MEKGIDYLIRRLEEGPDGDWQRSLYDIGVFRDVVLNEPDGLHRIAKALSGYIESSGLVEPDMVKSITTQALGVLAVMADNDLTEHLEEPGNGNGALEVLCNRTSLAEIYANPTYRGPVMNKLAEHLRNGDGSLKDEVFGFEVFCGYNGPIQ
jgi:hypothetical protein